MLLYSCWRAFRWLLVCFYAVARLFWVFGCMLLCYGFLSVCQCVDVQSLRCCRQLRVCCYAVTRLISCLATCDYTVAKVLQCCYVSHVCEHVVTITVSSGCYVVLMVHLECLFANVLLCSCYNVQNVCQCVAKQSLRCSKWLLVCSDCLSLCCYVVARVFWVFVCLLLLGWDRQRGR